MKPICLTLALFLVGCGSLTRISSPSSVDLEIIGDLHDLGLVLVHPDAWRCDYDANGCRICRNWSWQAQEILIQQGGPHAEPERWSAPIGARVGMCQDATKRYAWTR